MKNWTVAGGYGDGWEVGQRVTVYRRTESCRARIMAAATHADFVAYKREDGRLTQEMVSAPRFTKARYFFVSAD